jgi:hypothetical protein
MERHKAYAFQSPLRIVEMRERLNALGRWHWIARDSDRFGEYTSSVPRADYPDPDEAYVRIVEPDEGPGYVIEFRLETERPDALQEWQRFEARIRDEVLAAIDATDVQPRTLLD